MVRRTNAPFGIAAGSPNFAQGGSGNRWRYDDELIRQSRGELYGEPMMQVLPSWAPYKWAFGDGGIQPEDAIADGAGEDLDRDLWGGFYYGYHPYLEHGYPAHFDDASYVHVAKGAHDPLYDPDQDMWHYITPAQVQPRVDEINPWNAAVARTFARGVPAHDAFSRAGHDYDRGHEEVQFEGHSA